MIRLELNYPYDKLGFPIRPSESFVFASFDGVFEKLSEPGWSSYTIIGTLHADSIPPLSVV